MTVWRSLRHIGVARGIPSEPMMRASLRQIDEDDVRVVTQTAEDDFLSIGGDVEHAYYPAIAEAGGRVCRLFAELKQAENARRGDGQIHQTRSTRLEGIAARENG